jgi:oxidase EvaA
MKSSKIGAAFLKSALSLESRLSSVADTLKWVREQNELIKVQVDRVNFNELSDWRLDESLGALVHKSGKFFTIGGIEVNTNWGNMSNWEQPIINQPEIGYLGIICSYFDDTLHFLLQAKVEPGNVNNVQLSPTLQATKSNYTQVHEGKKPLYLDYFLHAKPHQVILDQLQSEQGARFYKKRNRNIIILIEEPIQIEEGFVWLTLAQIKELMRYDNIVNMDTRTVISGIPFEEENNLGIQFKSILNSQQLLFDEPMVASCFSGNSSLHDFDAILNWLTVMKCRYELEVIPKSIFSLKDWVISKENISHVQGKYFKVIATKVSISNREVTSWTQPLVEPCQQGIVAFILKKINGVYHFLVQAKLECGNFDIVEMAPTVQCLTGSYDDHSKVPFLSYVLQAKAEQLYFDTLQSEEGGRFYREQNRNLIVLVDSDFPEQIPENYCWITQQQMITFIKFNNFLNIQARSLLASLRLYNFEI